MRQSQNSNRNGKSDAEQAFEQAGNTSRFIAQEADSRAAREKAVQYINQDRNNTRKDREDPGENTNTEVRRDNVQSHDTNGESQDINYDNSRP